MSMLLTTLDYTSPTLASSRSLEPKAIFGGPENGPAACNEITTQHFYYCFLSVDTDIIN